MHVFLVAAALVASIVPVTPGAANKQPQLAVSGNRVYLAFGSNHTIWLAQSSNDGRSFSAPSPVAELQGLALGRHRGPRVVAVRNAILVSAIGGNYAVEPSHVHAFPGDGDLLVWRSVDGGHTWAKPVTVNDVPGSAREGLHAMASDGHGTVAAVWLDHRASGARLYGSISHDAGRTWSKNLLLYQSPSGTICQCCAPSLTATGPDRFDAMFRNFLNGDRDLYFVRWHGQTVPAAQKLGTGAWPLNACPMDGGGIADAKGAVYTAWRREQTVYLAQPGKPEVPLGQGKDVALAADTNGPYVAWTSKTGPVVQEPGNHLVRLSNSGGFVSLAALSNGRLLAAWEDNGPICTRVLP